MILGELLRLILGVQQSSVGLVLEIFRGLVHSDLESASEAWVSIAAVLVSVWHELLNIVHQLLAILGVTSSSAVVDAHVSLRVLFVAESLAGLSLSHY